MRFVSESRNLSQSCNNCSTTAAQDHLSSSSSFILLPKYCLICSSITGKETINSAAAVRNLHRPGQPLLSFGKLLNGQNIYCMFSMHQMLMLKVFGCWKRDKRRQALCPSAGTGPTVNKGIQRLQIHQIIFRTMPSPSRLRDHLSKGIKSIPTLLRQ